MYSFRVMFSMLEQNFCSFLVLVVIDAHSQAGVSHNLMSPRLLALEGLQNDCVQPWFQGSEKLFVMLISSYLFQFGMGNSGDFQIMKTVQCTT